MTRRIAKYIGSELVRLYRCEQGAEGLEKLLIVAAIVLPLLGFLIAFRGAITDWVSAKWTDVAGPGNTDPAPVAAP